MQERHKKYIKVLNGTFAYKNFSFPYDALDWLLVLLEI